MSPNYQADNDAALRASLTTLLSCAAAARGLPKNEERRTTGAGVVPSSQPMELRLVPESELMATNGPPTPPPTTPASGGGAKTARTASNSSAPSAPSSNSGREQQQQQQQQQRDSKRGPTTQNRPPRAAKKKRTSTGATLLDGDSADATPFFSSVSPTLLTWVVSAGVVVLVSVVGFGAGYVIGREVGRQEGGSLAAAGSSSLVGAGGAANTSSAAAAAGCGGELVRAGGAGGSGTLRRFRWGGVAKSVAA